MGQHSHLAAEILDSVVVLDQGLSVSNFSLTGLLRRTESTWIRCCDRHEADRSDLIISLGILCLGCYILCKLTWLIAFRACRSTLPSEVPVVLLVLCSLAVLGKNMSSNIRMLTFECYSIAQGHSTGCLLG